jgi:hypothetical protein
LTSAGNAACVQCASLAGIAAAAATAQAHSSRSSSDTAAAAAAAVVQQLTLPSSWLRRILSSVQKQAMEAAI